MIWEIAEIVAAIVECVIIVHFLSKFLGYKSDTHRFIKFMIGFVMIAADGLMLPMFTKSDMVIGTLLIVICLVYSVIFLKGNIYIKVFAVFLCNILILVINSFVLTGFSAIYGSNFETLISSRNIVRFEILVSTKFLYLFFTQLILAICRKKEYELNKTEWLAVTTIFLTTIIGAIAVFQLMLYPQNSDLCSAVILTGLILINIAVYFFMVKNSKDNRNKIRSDLLELQLCEQRERISEINQMYEEILQIRHDMKKCVSCASALIQNGSYLEAEKYLQDIAGEKLGTVKDYVILKNNVVSAVINSKLSQCRREGICAILRVSDCIDSFSETDISVLLANMFDNAIEACRKCQDNKFIEFSIEQHMGYIKILMRNPLTEDEIKRKGFATTKTDKKNHGFGIKTIKEIAEKYDGMADFRRDNGEFIADIWIKNNVKLHVTH